MSKKGLPLLIVSVAFFLFSNVTLAQITEGTFNVLGGRIKFEEVNNLFGSNPWADESPLTSAQQKTLWKNKYNGKLVTWAGRVEEVYDLKSDSGNEFADAFGDGIFEGLYGGNLFMVVSNPAGDPRL